MSHLYALHPGEEFANPEDAKWLEAAQKSIRTYVPGTSSNGANVLSRIQTFESKEDFHEYSSQRELLNEKEVPLFRGRQLVIKKRFSLNAPGHIHLWKKAFRIMKKLKKSDPCGSYMIIYHYTPEES